MIKAKKAPDHGLCAVKMAMTGGTRSQNRLSTPCWSKHSLQNIYFNRSVFSGVVILRTNIEERAVSLARYIIENRATVRSAAKKFGVSKSKVHKDLSERLPVINRGLYRQVKEILNENKAERHIRGGIATRKKYKGN